MEISIAQIPVTNRCTFLPLELTTEYAVNALLVIDFFLYCVSSMNLLLTFSDCCDGTDEYEEGIWVSLITNETLSYLGFHGAQGYHGPDQNCRFITKFNGGAAYLEDYTCDQTAGLSSLDAFGTICEKESPSGMHEAT